MTTNAPKTDPQNALPLLIDMHQVAARLSTSERHIRRLVAERRIPFVRVGRFIRFDPAELVVWLNERRSSPTDRAICGPVGHLRKGDIYQGPGRPRD